ncbi:MAG: hypothetical protein ABIJ05_01135 [Patescibacteria group bacterium]
MAKTKLKIEARKLRKTGESIKKIAKLLNVSPSSVSTWCRDIKLTSEQIKVLEKNARDPNYGRRLSYSLKQQAERIEKTNRLCKEGIEEVGNLNRRELFLTGIALYWGEGFKKDSQAGLASLSPDIIKFFLKWLKECFGYSLEDLIVRITLNISHKHRIDEITKYWVGITGIPLSNFRKPFYQKVKWKKVYEKPDEYHGVLRIKVRRSTDFLRKISGYIKGLSLQV